MSETRRKKGEKKEERTLGDAASAAARTEFLSATLCMVVVGIEEGVESEEEREKSYESEVRIVVESRVTLSPPFYFTRRLKSLGPVGCFSDHPRAYFQQRTHRCLHTAVSVTVSPESAVIVAVCSLHSWPLSSGVRIIHPLSPPTVTAC